MARGLSRRGLRTAVSLGMLAALAGCAAVAPAPQHIDFSRASSNSSGASRTTCRSTARGASYSPLWRDR